MISTKGSLKVKGNSVRRWKLQDHFSEFLARETTKFMAVYVSIINMQERREVRDQSLLSRKCHLMRGERTLQLNSHFMNIESQQAVTSVARNTLEGLPYTDSHNSQGINGRPEK